jgi:putative ABC transport system ATP-binding protein
MVIDIMRQMKQEFGVTFIFSTHDPKIVSEVDTVYTLHDGILVDQTKENVG